MDQFRLFQPVWNGKRFVAPGNSWACALRDLVTDLRNLNPNFNAISCLFNGMSTRIRSKMNPFLCYLAKCDCKACKNRLDLIIERKPNANDIFVEFKILVQCANSNHPNGTKMVPQIRGPNRVEVAKQIAELGPKRVSNKSIFEMDQEMAAQGMFNKEINYSVARKIASESSKKLQLDKDD